MAPYRLREVIDTVVLVLAAVVVTYGATLVLGGPLLWTIILVLFFVAAALAPAPWVAPIVAPLGLLVALVLDEAFGTACPQADVCEPAPFQSAILVPLLGVFVPSLLGALVRSVVDWRRRQHRAHPPS